MGFREDTEVTILQRDARFKEIEVILRNYLEQSPENIKKTTVNHIIDMLEGEINGNIRHDIKWKSLLDLIGQVKGKLLVQEKSFRDSLKVDVQANPIPTPVVTKQPDIKEAFEEKYGVDAFETKGIYKIQDEDVRNKLLEAHGTGIEQYANRFDIFLIEEEDKELGGQLIGFYMMDKKTGKVKRINNMVPEEEKSAIYSGGEKEKQGVVKFNLADESELIVYRDESGKLSIASNTEHTFSFIKSEDMMNREEEQR